MAEARAELHRRMLANGVLGLRPRKGEAAVRVVNIADTDNTASKRVSVLLGERLCAATGIASLRDAVATEDPGASFQGLIREYLAGSLAALPVAPRPWTVRVGGAITDYAQYHHLEELKKLSDAYEELQIHMGADYLIRPDILVFREPLPDGAFGDGVIQPGDRLARATFLRLANRGDRAVLPLLHGSVSCKWTLRSDRAQNARTEALNLIRNRKGRVPAITVVTAEPMPSRLASLADGTGDVDRVYHVALYELQAAVDAFVEEAPRMKKWKRDLDRMVRGLRLADISDLPFDLAI
jgi:NgoMIV restriction enzyme